MKRLRNAECGVRNEQSSQPSDFMQQKDIVENMNKMLDVLAYFHKQGIRVEVIPTENGYKVHISL